MAEISPEELSPFREDEFPNRTKDLIAHPSKFTPYSPDHKFPDFRVSDFHPPHFSILEVSSQGTSSQSSQQEAPPPVPVLPGLTQPPKRPKLNKFKSGAQLDTMSISHQNRSMKEGEARIQMAQRVELGRRPLVRARLNSKASRANIVDKPSQPQDLVLSYEEGLLAARKANEEAERKGKTEKGLPSKETKAQQPKTSYPTGLGNQPFTNFSLLSPHSSQLNKPLTPPPPANRLRGLNASTILESTKSAATNLITCAGPRRKRMMADQRRRAPGHGKTPSLIPLSLHPSKISSESSGSSQGSSVSPASTTPHRHPKDGSRAIKRESKPVAYKLDDSLPLERQLSTLQKQYHRQRDREAEESAHRANLERQVREHEEKRKRDKLEKSRVRFLVAGTLESGKTTIIRQAQLMFGNLSSEEQTRLRFQIISNIYTCAKDLAEALFHTGLISELSTSHQRHAEKILTQARSGAFERLLQESMSPGFPSTFVQTPPTAMSSLPSASPSHGSQSPVAAPSSAMIRQTPGGSFSSFTMSPLNNSVERLAGENRDFAPAHHRAGSSIDSGRSFGEEGSRSENTKGRDRLRRALAFGHSKSSLDLTTPAASEDWNREDPRVIARWLVRDLPNVWNDPRGVKDRLLSLKNESGDREIHWMDNIEHFIKNCQEMSLARYVPSMEDLLLLRDPTTKASLTDLEHPKFSEPLRLVDIGSGGREARNKSWLHEFPRNAAVIFTLSLTDYDQVVSENKTFNRLREALTLWDSMLNSRHLKGIPFFVLFTKADLARRQLQLNPFDKYFTDFSRVLQGSPHIDGDYADPCNLDHVVKYLQQRMERANRSFQNLQFDVCDLSNTEKMKDVWDSILVKTQELRSKR